MAHRATYKMRRQFYAEARIPEERESIRVIYGEVSVVTLHGYTLVTIHMKKSRVSVYANIKTESKMARYVVMEKTVRGTSTIGGKGKTK